MDSLVQFFAYLIVAVPITVLIAGIILYFLFPYQRMVTGIILTSLGGTGLLIYSGVLNIAITKGTKKTSMILLVAVELITLILGIISLFGYRTKVKSE